MRKMARRIGSLALALTVALGLASCSGPKELMKDYEDITMDSLGMGVQYWLSPDEILVAESKVSNGLRSGVQFAKCRPGVFQRTPLPELTAKIGETVQRWQLSPDHQKLLALLKEGSNFSYMTINLDGSQAQSWKIKQDGDFYMAWLPDSRHWAEFREAVYGKEKDNVIIHDREQPTTEERYTLPVQRVRMMTRQYQNLYEGYKWVDAPIADWPLQNRKGPFHLQIKDYRAEKPPLQEYTIPAPEYASVCGIALSPDRTVLAWVGYQLGQEPKAHGKPTLSLWFTRLDTKETKKVFEQDIALDNYYKTDWDKYVLPAWSPDGKRISLFVEKTFRIVDYTAFEKSPPPASAAISL